MGDVRSKAVLDLGCEAGGNTVVLLKRDARVTAIDISPDLIVVAEKRLSKANVQASLTVGDAYNTRLPDESVDVVFCIALIHRLDLKLAREKS